MGYFDDYDYIYDDRFNNRAMKIMDIGYGEYKTIHDYVIEPEEVGRLKARIRAKKLSIQMLERELMELEERLNDEVSRSKTR